MTNRRAVSLGLQIIAVASIVFFTACDPRSQAVFNAPPVTSGPQETADVASKSDVPKPDEPTQDVETTSKRVRIPPPSTELLRTAIACTVRLRGFDFDGSGVILGKIDGFLYIMTVQHAVGRPIQTVELFSVTKFQGALSTLRDPELVSQSERVDLALLRVKVDDDTEFPHCQLTKDVDPTQNPDFAYSCGCSEGGRPTVLRERITGSKKIVVPGTAKNGRMWTTENSQKEGRSGGPLLDVNGYLLGIASGKAGGTGYYCHSKEISDYLIDKGPVGLLR